MDCTNMKDARTAVDDIENTGSITAAFKRQGKGKVTYSHRQHTKMETKLVTHSRYRTLEPSSN